MNFVLYSSFVSKLTFKKTFNALKAGLSYGLSNILKKPVRWGFPISISVEPTNFCNLRCPQCPVGLNLLTRPKGFMDFETFKLIIDQAYPYLLNLFVYFQGEPLLHKQLPGFIRYATGKNIFTGLATNAQFLDYSAAQNLVKSKLDYIIISMDGTEQQTYEKYRAGGKLDKVIQAVQNISLAKKQLGSKLPSVELQFIVFRHNQHQIKDFLNLAKQLKVNKATIKSAQIEDFSTIEQFIPAIPRFSRYTKVNGQWKNKRKLKNRCWRLWNSVVITWDGTVVPCCYDKDAQYAFGSVYEGNLFDLVKNEKFKTFAFRVLTDQQSIDICRNCNG